MSAFCLPEIGVSLIEEKRESATREYFYSAVFKSEENGSECVRESLEEEKLGPAQRADLGLACGTDRGPGGNAASS
jgi:hypothetical protein